MEIQEKTIGPALVIAVTGRLTADNAEEFKHYINDTPARSRRIVLDLAKMEYIDSTGLGALVYALQKISDNAGDFKLASLQPKPNLVMGITRAEKIFDIHETVEAAIAALKP